jgi:folate-binding protein YgfZ
MMETFETVIVDQTGWGQIRARGGDRARFLQGMLTCDVVGLAKDAWARAATLSVKGRVLAVADVVNEGETFLLITEPVTGDKLLALLSKHAIADDVEFEKVSVPVHRVWDSPGAVWTAPPIFAARAGSPSDLVEVRRVEAGLPRYGVDVGEDYFPFEANLDSILCHTKGCYIGQEVVVRAGTRGQVKKKLVGLWRGDAEDAATEQAALKVTSSVVSPRLGSIALAYVHHTLAEPGTRLKEGVVAPLPFPPHRP